MRHGLQQTDGKLRLLPTKTARSRGTIPSPAIVRRVLVEHKAAQDQPYLVSDGQTWVTFTTPIGTPIDPANRTKFVQAACGKAGVRTVRMRDFRHGCVSLLLGLGVPPRTVMDIMGHTTMEMTMNLYGHVSLTDKQAALDRLGSLFDGNEK